LLIDRGLLWVRKCMHACIRRRIGFFAPPFLGSPWFNHYSKEARELVESGKKLVMSCWTLLDSLREKYSEDAVAKATEVLEQAAKKIEEITEKLKE